MMKLLVVLAALVCVASSASVGNGNVIVFKNLIQSKILPELPDPLKLNRSSVNFDEFGSDFVRGTLEIYDGLVTGLSTLTDQLTLNIILLTLVGDVQIGKLSVQTDASANVVLNIPVEGGSGTLVGAEGSSVTLALDTFSLTDLYAKININIATDRGTVSDLRVDVHFDGGLTVQGSGILWNDVEPNWDEVNQLIPGMLDDLISNHNPEVMTFVTDVVNFILKDLSISEIIGAIGK